jgi:hypothetical protein
MTPLQEARARLATIDAKIKDIDAKEAARQKAMEPAMRRHAAFVKRVGKRAIIKACPQDEYVLRISGLASYNLGWSRIAGEAKSAKAITEAVLAGEKVTFGSGYGGVQLSAKGAAQRTRYVDPVTVRAIARLDKIASDLERRGREARQAWKDAKKAAYLASDAKVDVTDLAAVVGEGAWISRAVRESTMSDNYTRERLVDYERPNAAKHLEHVRSKSKEPCECGKCREARRSAEWAAAAKARAAREAA